ncbi:MAG TPA: hypothetical protein PLN30_05575, partial [Ferruginibacter sp.]|nr:hypothetical protein [Ferruginibacter sp.]
ALVELNLPLSKKQVKYLALKNKRRFVGNCISQYKQHKNFASVKELWQKAGFQFKDMIVGLFH